MSRYAKDTNGNWHIIAGTGHEADNVVYDNTTSGLTATNVQDAIDEIIPITLKETLASGSTSVTFSDSAIKTTSLIDIYTDTWGLNPITVTTTAGQTVLTFEAQSSAHSVAIIVH